MEWFSHLLDDNFMPHGHCLLWLPDLLFLHIVGDLLTVIAYFVIPLALVHIIKKRKDLAFNWIFLMFAAFIFLCGISHIFTLINIWHGYYYMQGIAKLATGIISIITAFMIWKLIPKALALPSNIEFRAKNKLLEQTQLQLLKANQVLEKRVQERTEELQQLAITDALTGIMNRRGLINHLSSEIERALRYSHNLSLIMIDIDHFKKINDDYGHPVGDMVLIEIAKLISSECRGFDHVGRYGGEEFLILLPETDMLKATEIAERIRVKIEQHSFNINSNFTSSITCSLGVAQLKNNQNQESLLKTVDQVLYTAKNSGRNTVTTKE